jgi:restriction endonuclease
MPQFPSRYMTPAEFEEFVASSFEQTRGLVDDLTVTVHERIEGLDGQYDFDATVRYRLAGMDFLVVVEAKHHRNPIKREVVQTLYAKMLSVGAQKGVIVATAPFQTGAVAYARAHRIALVSVTDGRYMYETRGTMPNDILSKDEASRRFGTPTFVGYCYSMAQNDNSIYRTLITGCPEDASRLLLRP